MVLSNPQLSQGLFLEVNSNKFKVFKSISKELAHHYLTLLEMTDLINIYYAITKN